MTSGPDEARRRAFWQEQFALATDPRAWWLSARRLMQASELLWKAFDADLKAMRSGKPGHTLDNLETGLAWMLLTGLALENLAKAVLLKRNPSVARPGRLPKWPGDGHDLNRLFSHAVIGIGADEREMLERLTEFVRWRGRYPIPGNYSAMLPRSSVPGGGTPYMMPTTDHGMAVNLFDRLSKLLEITDDTVSNRLKDE